jgi:hypothetical protein
MLTDQVEDMLRRLKAGTFDSNDIESLEKSSPGDFLAELEPIYRCRFQERRLGNKWEVGIARLLRHELAVRFSKGSVTPNLLIIPVFHACLFVSGEGESITGIGSASRLVVKPITKPFRGFALTSGRGFKLDKTPDGWHLKAMPKRTTKLTEELLQKRGWRFDEMWNFVRAS